MLNVTIYNEYKHEREDDACARVYPDGIHACLLYTSPSPRD